MNRFLRLVVVLAMFGCFGALVCGGVVLVLSGGQPVAYIQKAFLRISVLGREDAFDRSMSRTDSTPVRFVVNVGDTPHTVAENLWVAGLVPEIDLFVAYARLNDLDRQLEAGTYFLSRTQTLAEIAVALTDSRSSHIPFGFLEGLRVEQLGDLIDSPQYAPYFDFSGVDFVAAVRSGAGVDPSFAAEIGLSVGTSVEGLLFPDQYQLPPAITPIGLRDWLLASFRQRIGAQIIADAQAQGFTLYEMVILASIVQREAVHDDEMAMIASAYRNRLAIGMKLDADPTVQYGLGGRDGLWWPGITFDDYTGVLSPFNTYLNTGLPPAPIANPGLAALQAAVYPATSNYLYFRADCRSDGYHTFAATYEEHLANGC